MTSSDKNQGRAVHEVLAENVPRSESITHYVSGQVQQEQVLQLSNEIVKQILYTVLWYRVDSCQEVIEPSADVCALSAVCLRGKKPQDAVLISAISAASDVVSENCSHGGDCVIALCCLLEPLLYFC